MKNCFKAGGGGESGLAGAWRRKEVNGIVYMANKEIGMMTWRSKIKGSGEARLQIRSGSLYQ